MREPDISPRPVVERARWQIHGPDGRPAGSLIRYEILDPDGPVAFYRVVDLAGRWVGHVRHDGWFTRSVPFQEREEDLGLYPMERGVAALFGESGRARLVPGPWEGEEIPDGPQPATIRRTNPARPLTGMPWR